MRGRPSRSQGKALRGGMPTRLWRTAFRPQEPRALCGHYAAPQRSNRSSMGRAPAPAAQRIDYLRRLPSKAAVQVVQQTETKRPSSELWTAGIQHNGKRLDFLSDKRDVARLAGIDWASKNGTSASNSHLIRYMYACKHKIHKARHILCIIVRRRSAEIRVLEGVAHPYSVRGVKSKQFTHEVKERSVVVVDRDNNLLSGLNKRTRAQSNSNPTHLE
jgi:hypothetical protein